MENTIKKNKEFLERKIKGLFNRVTREERLLFIAETCMHSIVKGDANTGKLSSQEVAFVVKHIQAESVSYLESEKENLKNTIEFSKEEINNHDKSIYEIRT